MRLLAVSPVIILLLAGCAEFNVTPGISTWSWDEGHSMLPDFEGQGQSFPVVYVHSHTELSKQQKKDFAENPVVCADLGGVPLLLASDVDAVACAPPEADVATGRIFMDSAEFDDLDATAVALIRGGCGPHVVPLDSDEPGFAYNTIEHQFRITWEGDHFNIDGHNLTKGNVLKATYWIDKGDDMDERFVRVSFDFPGYWLTANVGPDPRFVPPPTPETGSFAEGELLQLEMAANVASLPDALVPLMDAMPGEDVWLTDASVAVVDGRLTELVVGLRSEDASVRWYMASREGDVLRVLGNNTVTLGAGLGLDAALAGHGDLGIKAYPSIDAASSVRFTFAPDKGWDALAAGAAQRVDLPAGSCEDCIYMLQETLSGGSRFAYAPDALPTDTAGAPTWHIQHYRENGSAGSAYYQGAIKAS